MDDTSAYIEGSYIEGFGDDFVEAAIVVLFVLAPAVVCLIYWWYVARIFVYFN